MQFHASKHDERILRVFLNKKLLEKSEIVELMKQKLWTRRSTQKSKVLLDSNMVLSKNLNFRPKKHLTGRCPCKRRMSFLGYRRKRTMKLYFASISLRPSIFQTDP